MSQSNIVSLRKKLVCPNKIILERFRRNPEYGPKIQFFSGGSALKKLSSELTQFTYNSVHLITPFDSGGSSFHLRNAFNMLAVGDFRNRLMALADKDFRGNPEVVLLFSRRLSQDASQEVLLTELESMIKGEHPLVKIVPGPLRRIIQSHLRLFLENMPPEFDLRGASIGNLVLVGGYLNHGRDLDPVLYLFSKLVEVRGIVRPVSTEDLHLGVELEDGEYIIGQHRITDPDTNIAKAKIKRFFLNQNLHSREETQTNLDQKIKDQINTADLICYPYGSFYTSIMACLVLNGMGETIAQNPCPKVYIPNLGGDIEQRGLNLAEEIQVLLNTLKVPLEKINDVLDIVILDENDENYDRSLELETIRKMNLQIVRAPIAAQGKFKTMDLTSLLLAIAS